MIDGMKFFNIDKCLREKIMRKFTIVKANSHKVSCVEQIPDNPKGIAIIVHGFTSSKESPTVQMLLKKFPEAGIGAVGIDLPSHGVEDSYEEELRVDAGIDSIAAAEQYVRERYPDQEIYYFASSFGAYLTALYISTRPHKGRKAFFRSAAVNMPSLFISDNPTKEEAYLRRELDEKGFFEYGFGLGQPVRVTKGFVDDMGHNDLFEKFDPERFGHHSVAMAHGAEDTVIDPAAAAAFASKYHLTETVFEGEGHALGTDPATPGKVADLAIAHFKGGVIGTVPIEKEMDEINSRHV